MPVIRRVFFTFSFFVQIGLLLVVSSCEVPEAHSPKELSASGSDYLMIFAAASLAGVLEEAADSFEVHYTITVKTNMASSGTCARQIVQGQLPDLFISADSKWMEYLDSLGYISKGTITTVAQNDLVLVVPNESLLKPCTIDSGLNFVSLSGSGLLSIGDPNHVPAGKYAKEALEYFGWYASVAPRLLPAKDVRSACMMVEMREAPLGIVYHTDIHASRNVRLIGTFPEQSHTPIIYLAGVCRDRVGSKLFLSYLTSKEAGSIWARYGFTK